MTVVEVMSCFFHLECLNSSGNSVAAAGIVGAGLEKSHFRFESNRADIADCRVPANEIVIYFNVIENIGSSCVSSSIKVAFDSPRF